MTWDEALASLDMAKLGGLARFFALRTDLAYGYTEENLLVDTMWEAWRNFGRYNSGLSAFQTWVVYLLRHTVSWHKRSDSRATLFSQSDMQALRYILDPNPTPEALVMQREAMLEAEELIQRIEIAIEVLSRPRTKRRNLAVFRTYQQLLTESTQVQTTQLAVATRLGTTQQAVSIAMKRIADICERCGFCV